jgi:hypothetical protein
MHTASLVMKVVCTTQAAVKQLICRVPGVSRGVGTHSMGVLVGLAACFVVSELRLVVLGGVEWGTGPLSTSASMMTWWLCWVFRCKRGSGEQAGVGCVSGKCLRAVLVYLSAYFVISGLWFVFQRGPE